MSEFLDIFLNTDESNNFPSAPQIDDTSQHSEKTSDEILIKIRDQEIVNNDYIQYFIEIYITNEDHFWLEKIKEKSWNVYRRYREFEELRKHLVTRYPASIIPPLPSKVNSLNPLKMSNQKNDTDFIDCRRQRLEWFLKRLTDHPRLRIDEHLFKFLHDDQNWQNSIDNLGQSVSEKISNIVNWRWLNVQSQLISLFDDVNQINELLKSNTLCDEAKVIIDRGRQLQIINKNLLDGLLRIEENNKQLHLVYKNYGEAFYDWCGMTETMGNGLQTLGHLSDNYSSLSPSDCPLTLAGDCRTTTSAATQSYIANNNSNNNTNNNNTTILSAGSMLGPLSWIEIVLLLREYYEFGESWINLGGRLALLSKKLSRTQDSLDEFQSQLNRLNSGQPQKTGLFSSIKIKFQRSLSEMEMQEIRIQLESSVIDTKQKIENLQANKELFFKYVEEEIHHFEDIYTRQMRRIMYSYAHNQLVHSERCLRLWQRARQSLDEVQ